MQPKLNFPDNEKLVNTIKKLKNADLSKISYQKIINAFIKDIVIIPVCIADIHKDYSIFRARINKNGEIFTSEKDISYRTDYEKITQYGRANIPHQSMFYGAIESSEIKYPMIVNLFELSELFREPNNKDGEIIMTVGKWRIKKEFKVIEMVFSKGNIEKNSDVKESYEYQINLMLNDHPKQIKQIEDILVFFSDEFAKKSIKGDFDYKISSAYMNYTLSQRPDMHGITYSSVRTDYKANNIALFPDSVEQYLKLEMVSMFKIIKKGNRSFIYNLAIAADLGNYNSEFKWIDIQNKNENDIKKIISN